MVVGAEVECSKLVHHKVPGGSKDVVRSECECAGVNDRAARVRLRAIDSHRVCAEFQELAGAGGVCRKGEVVRAVDGKRGVVGDISRESAGGAAIAELECAALDTSGASEPGYIRGYDERAVARLNERAVAGKPVERDFTR